MRKVKIMLIAPYKGLIYMFEEIAAKRNDVELHCLQGDTTTASDMIQRLPFEKYDILVSRGHTCTLLQQSCHRHIVDVGVSIYDLLCSIRMAQNYMGKFAVVGFANVIYYAHVLNELMQYQTNIVTLDSTNEISDVLQKLKQDGYSLIVGDVVTVKAAQDIGLQTILITTSPESVKHTLNSCVSWFHEQERFRQTLQFNEQILNHCDENIVILTKSHECVFQKSNDNNESSKKLEQTLYNYIDTVLEKHELHLLKKIENITFSIRAYTAKTPNDGVIFYYKEALLPKTASTFLNFYDITTLPKRHCEYMYLLSASLKSVLSLINTNQSFTRPIVIEGASGSGQDTLAFMIYENSKLQHTPLIVADCRFAQNKDWYNFLTKDNSAILKKGQTIYFKNIHLLKENAQMLLYKLLKDSSLYKFNHLIFSYDTNDTLQFNNSKILYEILNDLHSITVYTPDLNKCQRELPTLLTWYLNDFNSKMSKQVIAFQPDAITALQNFTWHDNFKQLRRIVSHLLTEATTPYITAKAVENILNKERREQRWLQAEDITTSNMMNGTLDEITQTIIQYVYKQENYNQTRTAKRLNISRATLRRKLGL